MPLGSRQQEHLDGRDPAKVVLYAVAGALVVVAAVFIGRYVLFQQQMKVVQAAVTDISATTTKSLDTIQQTAAAASQAALARAEAQRQAKAQAERDQSAMQRAAADEARRVAVAKEAAWKRFFKPTEMCANPDNSSRMECANGYARAKKAFEQQWAEGKLASRAQ